MADVHLQYLNEVHVRIITERGILMEICDHFTYFAENYKYHPKVTARLWDGKICLINRLTGVIYAGLAHRIKKFCDAQGYSFSFDEQLAYDNVSEAELKEFISTLGLPANKEERGYQFDSILKCLRSRRRTLLSPTSSGKSLIIYILARWYAGRTLIIVSTTGLVAQMESDFREYGFTGTISNSLGGLDKGQNIEADMVITTWQSLDNGRTKVDKSWYNQFDVVVGDEAHGAKATSLIKILSAMENVRYRFGTTGTLGDNKLNTMTIEGLFGPQYQSITTREMIDQGYAADLTIKCIVLRYPAEACKALSRIPYINESGKKAYRSATYQEEVEFLMNYEPRNRFITNLVKSLKQNKLVFFRLKEHGQLIYESLKDEHNSFYIDGDVKTAVRERIRHAIEDEENATLVGSLGTTSTGVSINRLKHMIAAHPSKSKIKVLQSIGRMLRKHEEKIESGAILYDIVDDLSNGKTQRNFTFKHFEERVKIYDLEQFEYKIYTVGIK